MTQALDKKKAKFLQPAKAAPKKKDAARINRCSRTN